MIFFFPLALRPRLDFTGGGWAISGSGSRPRSIAAIFAAFDLPRRLGFAGWMAVPNGVVVVVEIAVVVVGIC